MNSWLTILTSTGFSAIVVVAIDTLVKRRNLGAQTDKLGTEATKIITDAATGVVNNLNVDNTRLRLELVDCMARCSRLERHVREWGEWADEAMSAVARGDKSFRKRPPRLHPPD